MRLDIYLNYRGNCDQAFHDKAVAVEMVTDHYHTKITRGPIRTRQIQYLSGINQTNILFVESAILTIFNHLDVCGRNTQHTVNARKRQGIGLSLDLEHHSPQDGERERQLERDPRALPQL